ncbi:MAG: saccharopine dehydrogenase family protein [Prochloraceae cyanobacterium]
MTKKVLVLGGQGRIGKSVALDIASHTDADVIVTGRQKKQNLEKGLDFLALDLADTEALRKAIASSDLVIHCAGPFHYRDGKVVELSIEEGVNYLDVSDHRSFYERVVKYRTDAIDKGVTAVLNTGIFPGISNSMVRQGVEGLDSAEKIHLSYVVAGSGGAGVTVMRTTFLGLDRPFKAWIGRKWQQVLPYSDRETVEFPQPYGKIGVYWFDVPETHSFPESFGVDSVITKFGSYPDLYNHLTWITAHIFPRSWVQSKAGIEFFSQVSYFMTLISDRFSGIGVAMRSEITGKKDGKTAIFRSTMLHENTAIAAGMGTGTVAELILSGKLNKPGIWPVERALSTDLFIEAMNSRKIEIKQELSWD